MKLLAIIFMLTSLSVNSADVLRHNFEDGKMLAKCSGNCPTVTDEITYNGQYSLKAELDSGSKINNYRTEIQESTFANYGDTFWYSFNIYLPESYVADSVWELVAQWHGYPDFDLGETWRNPPLSLHTTNGVWTIKNMWDSKANTFESGKRIYDGAENWDLGEYTKDKWTNWVFQVKWSYGEEGLIKVWKDSKLVVNKAGPNTFNDVIAPYFKAGIYKGWHHKPADKVKTRALYFDDISIKSEGG